MLFEKQMYDSGNFNGKNRWIIKKVTVLKKLLLHLATRGTYSPGDWRCDEAWCEQTLVYPPVMCQQRLVNCTWELNVMNWLFRHITKKPSKLLITGILCGKPAGFSAQMTSSWMHKDLSMSLPKHHFIHYNTGNLSTLLSFHKQLLSCFR